MLVRSSPTFPTVRAASRTGVLTVFSEQTATLARISVSLSTWGGTHCSRKRASAALVQAQSLSILQPLASLAFRSSSCNTDQTHELTYRITEPTPAGSRQSQNESWPGATTWEDTSQSPNGLLRKNLLITSSEQVMERSFSPLGTFFHHLNDTQGLVLAPKEATHLEEEITVHVQVKWGYLDVFRLWPRCQEKTKKPGWR